MLFRSLNIYAVGSKESNVPNFAMEFCNLSESGMKGRGKKIKMYRATDSWMKQYLSEVNHFMFFSKPKQPLSILAKGAQDLNVNVSVFNY